MRRLIISAPFGNYLQFPGTTPTLGTFTRHYRGGKFYRLWRCLLTLRYSWKMQAWRNKLGLPNPGIGSLLDTSTVDKIVSVHGFNKEDWGYFTSFFYPRIGQMVELNLSCPNVGHQHVTNDVYWATNAMSDRGLIVIAKLPPVRWFELAEPLYEVGVRNFHLCNTIPTPGGGLSGKPLKQYSLWAIEQFRKRWNTAVDLTGGGGITCEQDVRDYLSAGADRVAVGSMLFNPFNWKKIPRFVKLLEEHFNELP